jgi:hypothetical protein
MVVLESLSEEATWKTSDEMSKKILQWALK